MSQRGKGRSLGVAGSRQTSSPGLVRDAADGIDRQHRGGRSEYRARWSGRWFTFRAPERGARFLLHLLPSFVGRLGEIRGKFPQACRHLGKAPPEPYRQGDPARAVWDMLNSTNWARGWPGSPRITGSILQISQPLFGLIPGDTTPLCLSQASTTDSGETVTGSSRTSRAAARTRNSTAPEPSPTPYEH